MSSTNGLLKTVMAGAAFIFVGVIFSKLFNYFFRIIIARYMGAADYGLFTLGLAIIGVVTTFNLLGLPQGLVRYIGKYKGTDQLQRVNSIIQSTLILTVPLSIILGVLTFVFASPLSVHIFSKPDLAPVLQVLSIAIPLTIMITIFEKSILAFQKVHYNVISRNFIESIVKVAVGVLVLVLGYGIVAITSVHVLALFVAMVLLGYFLHKKIHSIKSVFTKFNPINRKLLRYSLPLLFSDIFAYLLVWTDTLLIGFFLVSSEVGIYNAAVPTALLVYVVPTTIRTMFFPVLTEHHAKGLPVKEFMKRISDWILFLTLPVGAFLVIFSQNFLGLFFGPEFVEGYISLIIICVAYFLYSLANTSNIMLYVLKKTDFILWNTIAAVIINIILNIIFIPKYGIMGAALASAIALIVRTVLIIGESYYYTKIIPGTVRMFLPWVSIFLVTIPAILLLEQINTIPLLVISSLVYGAIYLIVLAILGFFDKQDKEMAKPILSKLGL